MQYSSGLSVSDQMILSMIKVHCVRSNISFQSIVSLELLFIVEPNDKIHLFSTLSLKRGVYQLILWIFRAHSRTVFLERAQFLEHHATPLTRNCVREDRDTHTNTRRL